MFKPESLPQDLKELQARWPELLNTILQEAKSPADPETVAETLRRDKSFMDLVLGWEKMPTASQANAWEMIQDRLWDAARQTRPYCLRCGECCRRGSPVLFEQDRPILSSGVLGPQHLTTIRVGEKAFSNRLQKMVVVKKEQVKVKNAEDGRTCIFLSPGKDACLIYEDRPHQCRVMECWDPSRFDRILTLPPLTRTSILGPDNPLAEIMAEHDKRCSAAAFVELIEKFIQGDETVEEQALDMIFFDIHTRDFCAKKFGIGEEQIDFFFGAPLNRTCFALGCVLQTEEGKPPRLSAEKKTSVE